MSVLLNGPMLLAEDPELLAGITKAFNAGVAEGPFAILDRAGPSPESLASGAVPLPSP